MKSAIENLYRRVLKQKISSSELDYFKRVFQPLHDDLREMECCFSTLVLHCESEFPRLGTAASDGCENSQIADDI
jgi:hypothetical protein